MLKRRMNKLLILIIVSMLMFNFIGTNVVMASSDFYAEPVLTIASNNGTSYGSGTTQTQTPTGTQDNMASIVEDSSGLDQEMAVAAKMDLGDAGLLVLDGIVGILTYFERFKVIIIGGVCQFLATVVGESAGSTESITMVSPEDILFNKLAITDINFFNMDTFGSTNASLSGDNNPIKLLKQSVARWYMTLRTIAIIILLAVLIYIGIRMAMSSVASEKAEYKKMLMNWVVSLALVFLLHYIILFALNINNTFVNILGSVQSSALSDDGSFFGNYLTQMIVKSFHVQFTIGWSSAILYVCVVALTFVFLIMYIKRMITIAFLILISPVITITYSIDKLGDGKAQAFSAWLKEFLHNVFIQPFHCLIYLAFTSVAMNLLHHSGTLAATVLVVLTMFFILQSEKIIKKIFGIDSDSTGNAMATAAVLSHAYGKLNIKKPSAPTNVKGSNPSPNVGTSSRVASMAATNNMAAVTPANGVVSTAATLATVSSNASSANLSEALSGGSAHVSDYDALMGNEDKQAKVSGLTQESMLSKQQQLARAQATDYDALMGNDEVNKQQVNRVPGILGKLPPEEPKRNQVYGQLGKVPEEKSMAEKAWGAAKAGYNFISDKQIHSGMAGAVIGGSLAGVGGADLAETIGAVGVGKKAQEAIEAKSENLMAEKKQKWENYLKDIDIRDNDRRLASDFSKYKNGSEYNSNQDIQKTRDYLNMTSEEVSNIKNKPEQNFVKSLHATRDLYANTYLDEDPNEKVIETMEKVINKEIEPVD